MMRSPRGPEGGPPARSGDAPRSELPPGPDVVLVLADRLDALERALGTVRRRGMSLKVLSLSRWGDDLMLVLRADTGAPVPDRWVAELAALLDVRHVCVAAEPAV